jgi:hypothetical protein
MLTDRDIKKLKGLFLTKENGEKSLTKENGKKFATKDDLAAFKRRAFAIFAAKADLEKFVTDDECIEFRNQLFTILDGIAAKIDNLEIDAVKHQLSKHERWYQPVAEHLNIKLAD